MIKTDKGQIEMRGNMASILADVETISNTVRNTLVENGVSKEMAEERIINIVKRGFMSEEEIEMAEEKIIDIVKRGFMSEKEIESILGRCK